MVRPIDPNSTEQRILALLASSGDMTTLANRYGLRAAAWETTR